MLNRKMDHLLVTRLVKRTLKKADLLSLMKLQRAFIIQRLLLRETQEEEQRKERSVGGIIKGIKKSDKKG